MARLVCCFLLVIPRQAPVSALAAEQLLDEPPLGQHHKAALFFVAPHDLQRTPELILHLLFELLSGKPFIGEDGLQVGAPRALLGLGQNAQGAHPFIGIGRHNNRFEQVTA